MVHFMRNALLLGFSVMLASSPVFAGPAVEQEGPLGPCVQTPDAPSGNATAAQAQQPWGVEIATAFSEQEALDEFARVKQDHADILGGFDPIVVEQCDLHMGTKPQYSARIGMASREDADNLCAKLIAKGGACIVQKN
jgi:SPOR domain